MRYRYASTVDSPLLARMNRDLIQDEGHRNLMTLAELTNRMESWLAQDYRAVIFELDADSVGYALFRHEQDFTYLRQFFIARSLRRRGLGKAAIQWLFLNAWKDSRRVRLEVLVNNERGVGFWKSVGFGEYALTMEAAGHEELELE